MLKILKNNMLKLLRKIRRIFVEDKPLTINDQIYFTRRAINKAYIELDSFQTGWSGGCCYSCSGGSWYSELISTQERRAGNLARLLRKRGLPMDLKEADQLDYDWKY